MSDKPIKAKPAFYAIAYNEMKTIAKDYGYNLVLHGSLCRDMDLIAIPWINDPKPEWDLIAAFDKYLRNISYVEGEEQRKKGYLFSKMPGGRTNYIIQLNRGAKWNNYTDEEWYLDISFTPFINCDK